MSSDRARKVKRIVFSCSESDKNSPDNTFKRTKSSIKPDTIQPVRLAKEGRLMWPQLNFFDCSHLIQIDIYDICRFHSPRETEYLKIEAFSSLEQNPSHLFRVRETNVGGNTWQSLDSFKRRLLTVAQHDAFTINRTLLSPESPGNGPYIDKR
jgi:hypothetical protein